MRTSTKRFIALLVRLGFPEPAELADQRAAQTATPGGSRQVPAVRPAWGTPDSAVPSVIPRRPGTPGDYRIWDAEREAIERLLIAAQEDGFLGDLEAAARIAGLRETSTRDGLSRLLLDLPGELDQAVLDGRAAMLPSRPWQRPPAPGRLATTAVAAAAGLRSHAVALIVGVVVAVICALGVAGVVALLRLSPAPGTPAATPANRASSATPVTSAPPAPATSAPSPRSTQSPSPPQEEMKPTASSLDKPLVGAWVDLIGPAYEAVWWGSVMTICCAPVLALVQVIGGRSPWGSLALVLPAGAFLVLAESALSGMV